MHIQKTTTQVLGALAITFAPLFGADTDIWFGNGYTADNPQSVADIASQFGDTKGLASNASDRFLAFNDTESYQLGYINLRNTNREGSDSTIFFDSGKLTVLGRTDVGGNSGTRGTIEVRGGELQTVTLSIANSGAYYDAAKDIFLPGATGAFTMTAGAVTVSKTLQMSRGADTHSILDISGGSMTVSGLNMNSGNIPTDTLSGGATSVITVSGTGELYGTNAGWQIGALASNQYGTSSAMLVVKDGGYVDNNNGNVYTQIGCAAGSTATISVQDGGIATFKKMTVGDAYQSTGVVEVSGTGELTTTFMSMANRSSSTGILNVYDSGKVDLGMGALNIAAASTSTNSYGAIDIAGGTVTAGAMTIITGANSSASINVHGGELNVANNINFGAAAGAKATLSLSSGTFAAGSLLVAAADGANATISVTGGTATIANTLNLATINADATLGKQAVYSQTGGTVTAGEVYVAANNIDTASNSAIVTISGGSLTSNTFFNLGASGANGTASAQVTVTGTGALTATTISVMRAGTLSANGLRLGTGAQAAATGEAAAYRIIIANGAVNTGAITNASGMLSMRAGGTLSATTLQVGGVNGATATVNVTGGVTTIADSMILGLNVNNATTNGVYSQGAGTVWVKQLTMANAANETQTVSAALSLTGGTLQVGNFLTMGSSISGTNCVANATVAAGATLNAGRINLYGGATLDIAGSLVMTAPVSGSNNVGVTDADLIIRNGATVSTIGNLNLNREANLTLEVGDAHNVVNVGGALNFSTLADAVGTQTMTLDFTNLTDPVGETTLLTAQGTITGFDEWYATKDTNLVVTGLRGYLFESLSLSADGKSLIATIAIPEPAAAAALLGLLGLALVARRRR